MRVESGELLFFFALMYGLPSVELEDVCMFHNKVKSTKTGTSPAVQAMTPLISL